MKNTQVAGAAAFSLEETRRNYYDEYMLEEGQTPTKPFSISFSFRCSRGYSLPTLLAL